VQYKLFALKTSTF